MAKKLYCSSSKYALSLVKTVNFTYTTIMPTKFYALSSHKGYQLVHINDIIYCKANGNYSIIYLIDGSHTIVSKQLCKVEKALPQEAFVRIHHSILVNLQHANYYNKQDGGVLIMKTGQQLSVSDSKKANLMNKLNIL